MYKDTRKNIMKAAKELFSHNGYAAVTTKEIAKKAGISEVTLFRHFENKRNLFNAIVNEQMHFCNISSFIKNEATYDVRHDLTIIATKMNDNYKENSVLIKMMIKDAIENSDVHRHTENKENSDYASISKYFMTLKEKGLIKDDPEKLLIFFASNIHGFAMRNYIFNKNNEDEHFGWLLSKVIDTILM